MALMRMSYQTCGNKGRRINVCIGESQTSFSILCMHKEPLLGRKWVAKSPIIACIHVSCEHELGIIGCWIEEMEVFDLEIAVNHELAPLHGWKVDLDDLVAWANQHLGCTKVHIVNHVSLTSSHLVDCMTWRSRGTRPWKCYLHKPKRVAASRWVLAHNEGFSSDVLNLLWFIIGACRGPKLDDIVPNPCTSVNEMKSQVISSCVCILHIAREQHCPTWSSRCDFSETFRARRCRRRAVNKGVPIRIPISERQAAILCHSKLFPRAAFIGQINLWVGNGSHWSNIPTTPLRSNQTTSEQGWICHSCLTYYSPIAFGKKDEIILVRLCSRSEEDKIAWCFLHLVNRRNSVWI